jgi:hypothetical protein
MDSVYKLSIDHDLSLVDEVEWYGNATRCSRWLTVFLLKKQHYNVPNGRKRVGLSLADCEFATSYEMFKPLTKLVIRIMVIRIETQR